MRQLDYVKYSSTILTTLALTERSLKRTERSFYVLFPEICNVCTTYEDKKNVKKNVPFFLKERKRTERTERSFEKNGCPTLLPLSPRFSGVTCGFTSTVRILPVLKTVWQFLNGRTRWLVSNSRIPFPFVIMQLGVLISGTSSLSSMGTIFRQLPSPISTPLLRVRNLISSCQNCHKPKGNFASGQVGHVRKS